MSFTSYRETSRSKRESWPGWERLGIQHSVREECRSHRFLIGACSHPYVERELMTSMEEVYAGYFDSLCTQNKFADGFPDHRESSGPYRGSIA